MHQSQHPNYFWQGTSLGLPSQSSWWTIKAAAGAVAGPAGAAAGAGAGRAGGGGTGALPFEVAGTKVSEPCGADGADAREALDNPGG